MDKTFSSKDKCLSEIERLRRLLQQLNIRPEVISPELAISNQWVVWAYEVSEQENGMFRVDKKPYQPKIPNYEVPRYYPSGWSDLETALSCMGKNPHIDGIGYIFAEGDGLIGVDFDNCRHPLTGVIKPEYQFWIDKLDSYAEVSPSGTGVKVWVRGTVADKYFKSMMSTGFRILNFADGEIEIYRHGQYFTVTTQILNGLDSIRDTQVELDVICEFSLSRTQRDFRYSSCPDHQPTELDENLELSLLKGFCDDMSPAYTDESDIQPNRLKATEINSHSLGEKLSPGKKDRFGKSKCNKCGRDSGEYEQCRVCYEAGQPEEKVEDAVDEYFSIFPGFSVVRQPSYEITIGSYKSKPDVVLLDAKGNLFAIAECKREGIIYDGIKQLKSYLSASDTQFGVFANNTERDDWIFYENLRQHNFDDEIPRTRFEAEILANPHVETIREEKIRLNTECQRLHEQHEQNVSNIESSSNRLDKLKNQIENANKRHTILKDDNEKLVKNNENLTIEIKKNAEQLAVQESLKLESTRNELTLEVTSLIMQEKRLVNTIETMQQQQTNLSEEINMALEISSLNQQKKSLKNDINTIQQQRTDLSEEINMALEISSLNQQKKSLKNDINTIQQQRTDLSEKVNMLKFQKGTFEKSQNKIRDKIRIERDELEKAKRTWWKEKEKQKSGIAYLEKLKVVLEKRIKQRIKAIQDINRLSRLDELEQVFLMESIYGQLEKEFNHLEELTLQIDCQRQLARENQQKYACIEQTHVKINQKRQQLAQISDEREKDLKQIRAVVNRLNAVDPEQKLQLDRHRKQLVLDLKNRKNNYSRLSTEIRQLQEVKSKLEIEVKNEIYFQFSEKDILPTYLQVEAEIAMLKTTKNELEAEIGRRIFKLIPKKD